MHEHIEVVADKCRACRRCEIACIAAHHGMSFKEAMKHRDELVSRVRVVKTDDFKTTVRCHQCTPAPCCNICPTGALQQEEDGTIIMRVQHCVACKMCLAVCPYGTITLETIGLPDLTADDAETLAQRARREVAVRCDMCKGWREKNGKRITACVEACPAHALSLVEPDGTILEAPVQPKAVKKTVPAEETENKPVDAAPQPLSTQPVMQEENKAESVQPEVASPAEGTSIEASVTTAASEEKPKPAKKPASAPKEKSRTVKKNTKTEGKTASNTAETEEKTAAKVSKARSTKKTKK